MLFFDCQAIGFAVRWRKVIFFHPKAKAKSPALESTSKNIRKLPEPVRTLTNKTYIVRKK